MRQIKKIRYSKKQWLRMMGSRKLNKKIKSLWNTCMKNYQRGQESYQVTQAIMNSLPAKPRRDREGNTLEQVVRECGTQKMYSEYNEYLRGIEMASSVDWQNRFCDAKIKQ